MTVFILCAAVIVDFTVSLMENACA